MKGEYRVPRVFVAGAFMVFAQSASVCEFDPVNIVGIVPDKTFAESEDPEVRKVAEANRKRQAIKDAAASRKRYLATGDKAALDEALLKTPDDPELRALETAHILRHRIGKVDFEEARRELREKIALQREAKRTPAQRSQVNQEAEDAAVKQEADEALVIAYALLLTKGRRADIGAAPERDLEAYCAAVNTHKKSWPNSTFFHTLGQHNITFGDPCKDRR